MKVLYTDFHARDISVERQTLRDAGIELIEGQCRTEDDVIRMSEGCSALLITYAPVNEKVFAARPEIGLCSRMGAGYDTIRVEDAKRHGVWVANSPDYGVGEVSTHALSMMLATIRGIVRFDHDVHQGNWHYSSTGRIPRASNMTVGVLGLGRIGKRFAHLARNLFKRVIAHDPYLLDGDFPAYVERVSIEELFQQADAISIHTLLNDETSGLVNARLLRMMKPGSYLVNTSRGGVINIDELRTVLAENHLAGVGLDVLPKEPISPDDPLLSDRRVILSPHAAFYSVESEVELRRKAAMNIVTWMRTGRPDYPVSIGTKQAPKA
jgi:phosphoglycerate dehydrogenase-like enzyme